ncbi:PREDICTED: dopamine D2-like receptor [Priapulus caudatus]|uniref:Dopamine D2-like receptor n=1 Tax=Priapulus caudatus TaxID=37621 RepID=A0ABM1DVL1_PRICU|nr:PREDICTED: dopamine D2-like receptor [Priapulus caudatus]
MATSSELADFYNDSMFNGTTQEQFNFTVQPPDLTSGRAWWAVILIVFPLLTMFGNTLVVLSVYKERSLQSVTNYFIVSLAVADIMVGTLVMPFAVYNEIKMGIWELGVAACDIYTAMDVTASTSSIFNLAAISVDRYTSSSSLSRSDQYAKHNNKCRGRGPPPPSGIR